MLLNTSYYTFIYNINTSTKKFVSNWESPKSVMTKVLDNGLKVSEFTFGLMPFGKGINLLSHPTMG